MAQRTRSNRVTKRSKKTRRKRPRIRLPKAFRVVPIPVKRPIARHAHVLGAEGIPPCPPGSVYVDKIQVDSKWYCVYSITGGGHVLVECP